MDPKEKIAAANALIAWFNSQDIAPLDAQHIMLKVIAKLLVGPKGPTLPHSRDALDDKFDNITLQLIHDINDRLHHVRRK